MSRKTIIKDNKKNNNTMKKAFLILSLALGLCAGSYAQTLFSRGGDAFNKGDGDPNMPGEHGQNGNQDGDPAPLGGGALLLIGFGAAYALSKKNKKD